VKAAVAGLNSLRIPVEPTSTGNSGVRVVTSRAGVTINAPSVCYRTFMHWCVMRLPLLVSFAVGCAGSAPGAFSGDGGSAGGGGSASDAGVLDGPNPLRDGSASGPFACGALPAPTPDPSTQLELSISYTDNSTGAPPENTVVRLCAAADPGCSTPRTTLQGGGAGNGGSAGGTGWVKLRADGTVSTKVELGFEGFFEASATQYPPTFRWTPRALRNPKTNFDSVLLRPAEIKFLTDQALGKPGSYDSTGHGIVFVVAQDCDQQPIAGASFTTSASDSLMREFYIINSSPSTTDTKTDSLGRGGFINVPPGVHTFTVFAGEGRTTPIGSSRVQVRAGAVSSVTVSPSAT